MCCNHVLCHCALTTSSSKPPALPSSFYSSVLATLGLRRKSDTLEARTKLTSHSALDLGGLPRLPFPFSLHEEWRRPQV